MNRFRGKTVNTAVLVVKSDKGPFCGLYCVVGIKKEQWISILSAVWYYSAIHEKKKLKKHKYWTHFEKLRFIPMKQNNMFYLLFLFTSVRQKYSLNSTTRWHSNCLEKIWLILFQILVHICTQTYMYVQKCKAHHGSRYQEGTYQMQNK